MVNMVYCTYTFCFLGFLRGDAPSGNATAFAAGLSTVLLVLVAMAELEVTAVLTAVDTAGSTCSFLTVTGEEGG